MCFLLVALIRVQKNQHFLKKKEKNVQVNNTIMLKLKYKTTKCLGSTRSERNCTLLLCWLLSFTNASKSYLAVPLICAHTHPQIQTRSVLKGAAETAHCPTDWYVNETYKMLPLHWRDFQSRSSSGWQPDKEPKLLLSGSKLSFLLSSFSSCIQT